MLFGDVADGPWYVELIREQTDVSAFRDEIVFGRAFAEAVRCRRRVHRSST